MTEPPRWHAALAYAVLGQVLDGLPEPARVDPAMLLADLDARWPGGLAAVRAELRTRGISRLPVQPLPADLVRDLPPAQLAAALQELQHRLEVGSRGQVATDRGLDADERRLQADAPPHHGS